MCQVLCKTPFSFWRGGFVTFSCSKNWHFWDLLWDSLNFEIPATKIKTKVRNPTTNFKNVSFLARKSDKPTSSKLKGVLHKTWRKATTNQKQAFLQVQGSPWNQTFEESYQKHYSSPRKLLVHNFFNLLVCTPPLTKRVGQQCGSVDFFLFLVFLGVLCHSRLVAPLRNSNFFQPLYHRVDNMKIQEVF